MKTYILYHANCTDGLGAKFAAWMKYGDKATYIPVQYGQPVPEIDGKIAYQNLQKGDRFKSLDGHPYIETENGACSTTHYPNGEHPIIPFKPDEIVETGIEVYIVDFSYPLDVLNELRHRVSKLVILDHHKTAQEALRGFSGAIFDMNKSGALLAWEYFHPGLEVPLLIKNVSDRDLWKFQVANTNEIHAGLDLIGDNMEAWKLATLIPGEYEALVEKGSTLLWERRNKVESMLKSVVILPYKGYKVGVLNTTVLFSEIGAAICSDLEVDFSMTYFVKGDGEVIFSFRSLQDGGLDVGEIAKALGGGGHKNSSGARSTLSFVADLLAGKL
jgi:uncharacterized protein